MHKKTKISHFHRNLAHMNCQILSDFERFSLDYILFLVNFCAMPAFKYTTRLYICFILRINNFHFFSTISLLLLIVFLFN